MKGQPKTKRVLLKILKIFGWIVFSIIILLMAVALIIQLPPVQNKITQKAISFLEKKIGTDVNLEKISIRFPKAIVVEGFYLEDQKHDTLLYAGKLSIDTDLWALTRHEIQLNNISLENTKAYISRPEKDSAYNFSYILKAFADSTAVADTVDQKSWKFSLEDLELNDIRAKYHDLLTGNILDLDLGSLEVSLDEFDLDNYKIVVDKIDLKDTRASVLQTKQPEVTEEVAEEKQPFTYDIGVAGITLENIHANYYQQALGQIIRLDLGKSKLKTDKIDLKLNKIDLKEFLLHNTFVSYQQLPVSNQKKSANDPEPTAEKKAEKQQEKTTPWKISLDKLDLAGNSIQFYDFTKPQTKNAVDFDHLWLSNLRINARELSINGSAIKCDLKNLAFREKSGFEIRKFSGGIIVNEKNTDINNLLLITGNSRIEMSAQAGYPSLSTLKDTYQHARIQADINQTSIAWRDLLYFNPALAYNTPMRLPRHAKVSVDASLNGTVNKLKLHHLVVRALSDTYLRTSGTITGLPDMKKLKMDVSLDKFYTTKYDMNRILPDTLIPESIDLPGWINVHGEYTGSMERAEFTTLLTSSIGSVDLKGKMNLDSASPARGYEGKVAIKDFHVGKLLKQPQTMGKLNMEASVNGDGLTPKEMNGEIFATVKDFDFKGYIYRDFTLDGRIKNQVFSGNAKMEDENLDFKIDGDFDYSKEVPLYHFTFDMRNADFHALHLTERELKARGTLDVNMATADFKILNGNLGLRKVAIFNGDELYAVDSLLFASIDQEGLSELKIDSDILSGEFKGSFNLFSIGDVIQEYFSTYYSLHDSTIAAKKDAGRQYFDFKLKLHKTELITEILIPQLTSFVPGEIVGQFDSEARKLDLKIDIHEIQYANIGVKSFLLSTNSDASKLNYNIFADKITIDSLGIDGLAFDGTVANDSIRTKLVILDSLDVDKYVLGGLFHSRDKEYEMRLLPNEVKLNYADWTVPNDNFIRFGGEKVLAHNIELVNGRERIIIDSKDDAASTLFIGFRELNLEYLVSMVSKEKAVSGLLHGDIFLRPDENSMNFTSNIGIKDFNISEIPWGDVSLAVDRKTPNRFDVDFAVQGKQNNVRAEGYYLTGDKPLMSITATISRFDLASIEPLTKGQVKKLKGSLTGQINIEGSPKKPSILGDISMRNAEFFSTYLNSNFSLNNETISLTPQGIEFEQFEMMDTRKNKATLNGLIATTDYKNFAFRLDLTTDNFRLMNTTEKDNDLFYGRVDVNTKIKIRGTMLQPKVDAHVSLSDDSHVTYIVPQSEAGVMEQEGIVKFVDKTFKNDPFMKSINPADTVKSQFTGIDLTARIELSDKESFTVVIDPTTEDQLTVKGNTTLLLEIDPTGDVRLSGRYEITEGKYNLSFYKFVKREFDIEKGSTMTWSGDPLNADMDIHAIYQVETAPIDLLSAQLTGSDPQEINKYKQRLPFLVYMDISGQLLKPEIGFRLDMPIDERDQFGGNIYAKLQDINTRESDLNKQVFALLILKRFISDNPFSNQGASGFEGTARTSVSKILTEQLNRLSENVKGVELSFDVKSYEDYSSGRAQGQTQLQLGLSKNLFNDRLVVKLSGNVDLEGENPNREVTDYIGDLALEYKLTEDGRFRITGFRNSNYDMIDGELTETGAGLIYVKDYNLLSELFKANAKKKGNR